MVFGESRSKDRARKRAAGKLLSVLLTVAMVLQGSPFAYAEEILAAMEQEDAVTPAVVEEPAAEGPVAEDATEESVAEDATEEAAPAEAEAVAIEGQGEADAESEPAEAVAAKTEYVYEDDTLKVTAKLDDAAAIPDDAQLMVTAITAESDKYNYDAYMTALNEGGQPKANGQNTMLYDVAFLVYAEDGTATEVQPTVGSVHVTFDFKKAQLESIGVEDSEQVSVTHLPWLTAPRPIRLRKLPTLHPTTLSSRMSRPLRLMSMPTRLNSKQSSSQCSRWDTPLTSPMTTIPSASRVRARFC